MNHEIHKIFKSSGIISFSPIQFEQVTAVIVWEIGCYTGYLIFSYSFSGSQL